VDIFFPAYLSGAANSCEIDTATDACELLALLAKLEQANAKKLTSHTFISR
jgi:hypothetical protein